MFPKVVWRFTFEDGTPGKIKIEINTFERSPAMPLTAFLHSVKSPYYTSIATIRTFQSEELVATKLRALYQRKKGRDLYDLWLALTDLSLDPEGIIAAFPPYRPDGVSGDTMKTNLESKLRDKEFCADVQPMIRADATRYDVHAAGELVMRELLDRLD